MVSEKLIQISSSQPGSKVMKKRNLTKSDRTSECIDFCHHKYRIFFSFRLGYFFLITISGVIVLLQKLLRK